MKKKEIIDFLKGSNTKLKKSLGQNYLIDQNVLRKISEFIRQLQEKEKEKNSEVLIIEIGCGLGVLTQYLLEFSSVLGIEIDEKNIGFLQKKLSPTRLKTTAGVIHTEDNKASMQKNASSQNHFFLIREDILKIAWKEFFSSPALQLQNKKIILVGNLPYHLVLKIIEHFSENSFFDLKGMVFLMQKEVAERLTAREKSPFYGIPSIFAHYHWEVRKLFTVAAQSFFPSPKVTSSLVSFLPRTKKSLMVKSYPLFKDLVKGSFFTRRKKIINSLNHYSKSKQINFNFNQIETALEKLGLSGSHRAEEISLDNFIKLSNLIDLRK